MSLSPRELERFTARVAAAPQRWRHLVRHARHTRIYEQIWDDTQLNAWLICWSHDQDTGFHDHDQSAAVIAVVDGHVREERLRLCGPPVARVLGPGSLIALPPAAIHRVLHCGSTPAVTIHAYSPPLRRSGSYRLGPAGELERASLAESEELRTLHPIVAPLEPARRPLDPARAGAGVPAGAGR